MESRHAFRKAILRGLGVVLPPLLTIALFFWAWSLVETYVLDPVDWAARTVIVSLISDISNEKTTTATQEVDGQFIPQDIFAAVKEHPGEVDLMLKMDHGRASASEIYHRYVRLKILKPWVVIIVFLVVFVVSLYFIGEVLAARLGRGLLSLFEKMINRIPLIRNVYSSVKQVTDFVVGDHKVEFNQIVAVQYPSQGIWSIGFVTGTSMRTFHDNHGEPFVSVLMPTSPMPVTGFTISVPKSQTVDLNITVDQAIQFVVSCGVVVPRSQIVQGANSAAHEKALVKQAVEGLLEQQLPATAAESKSEDD